MGWGPYFTFLVLLLLGLPGEAEDLPDHKFTEFIELDFFDQFQKALDIQQNDKESKAKVAYTRIVLQTLSDLTSKKLPSNLERLADIFFGSNMPNLHIIQFQKL